MKIELNIIYLRRSKKILFNHKNQIKLMVNFVLLVILCIKFLTLSNGMSSEYVLKYYKFPSQLIIKGIKLLTF